MNELEASAEQQGPPPLPADAAVRVALMEQAATTLGWILLHQSGRRPDGPTCLDPEARLPADLAKAVDGFRRRLLVRPHHCDTGEDDVNAD